MFGVVFDVIVFWFVLFVFELKFVVIVVCIDFLFWCFYYYLACEFSLVL